MALETNTIFLFLTLIFFLNSFMNNVTLCQSNPQNIEVFYPTPPPTSSFPPSNNSPPSNLQPSPPSHAPPKRHATSKKAIATAVGVTAASTLVVAAFVFFLCTKYAGHKKKTNNVIGHVNPYAATLQPVGSPTEFTRFDGNIKGLIVDEDGLDVLYWRKLEGSQKKSGPFHKEAFNNKPPSSNGNGNGKKSFSSKNNKSSASSSSNQVHPKDDQREKLLDSKLPSSSDKVINLQAVGNQEKIQGSLKNSEKLEISPVQSNDAEVTAGLPAAPPPPPLPKRAAPPPPPPPGGKKGPAPPPPPPPIKVGASASTRPPPAPKRTASGNIVEMSALGGLVVDNASDEKNDQVKLKPLHWEKVTVNRDHSMVWDKLDRGSFQYNGDMMEALFGTVATNRKSPKEMSSIDEDKAAQNAVAKIFILDSRRSQNIAIVIRSLGVSRHELIDGLLEGRGLSIEVLEKLTRMVPTREEKIQIRAFDGDVGRLADAESFLYHLLKAVPSAFTRVNAMLFRYTYEPEIQQLKDTLATLDSACTELRNRGVFLKLLEAILKAGNRLNAGTTRGDAKAFNLTALRKLSDYKSSDGKTTLLHFVVHEVVRNEGRRCVMNRNNSLNRSNSQRNSTSSISSDEAKSKEDQEKEFLKLGLPVVGGLSSEFTNVKKAASIDYDTLTNNITSLAARITETRQLVLQCGADGSEGEFIKEMKEFLGDAEAAVKAVQEEHTRVMEFVKKTTQYYQSGAYKDKQPLQLFTIVKDFLSMVDKACIDITRSLQQKKTVAPSASSSGSSSTPSSPQTPDVLRTRVTFPRLPDHFLTDKANGSDSDDDR